MKMSETLIKPDDRPRLPGKEMMALRPSVALSGDEGEKVGLEVAAKEIGRRIGGVRGRVGRVAMWAAAGAGAAAVVEGEARVVTSTRGMVVVMFSLPDPVDAVPVGS